MGAAATPARGPPLAALRSLATKAPSSAKEAPKPFNRTNCETLETTATITSSQDTTVTPTSPVPRRRLLEAPVQTNTLTAIAAVQGSKRNGTTFTVKSSSPGLGQANLTRSTSRSPPSYHHALKKSKSVPRPNMPHQNPNHQPQTNNLTLTIYIPTAGKLKITGNGITSTAKPGGPGPPARVTLQARRSRPPREAPPTHSTQQTEGREANRSVRVLLPRPA